jgi:putative oxidoreductase
MNALKKPEPYAYALLRIVFGFMYMCHGLSKIFGLWGGQKPEMPIMVVGGWIELIGGAMILIGLLTPLAAFIASGEMAVAFFKFHYLSPDPNNPGQHHPFLPIQNGGDLAVIYCFLALYMVFRGAGLFSVDALIMKNRNLSGGQEARVSGAMR